jgi:tRNA modification GTPase
MRQNLDSSKTLFALSTGSLPSAVAAVRLSGPDAFTIAARLFRPHSGNPLSRERGMTLGRLFGTREQVIDDDTLLLGFVGPSSFTGDDVVEFHCHGSVPIVRQLEAALLELGAVPAGRGGFSYRALLNGKLSTRAIEKLGDVYLAREPADLTRIFDRRDDALAGTIAVLREHLIRLRAILDTAVDFVEEYSDVVRLAQEPLALATRECSAITQRYSRFRHGGSGRRIVLAGRPNAGKSSLFNGLLCRYRAIVDEAPGTTRDVIEEEVEVGGRTWRLVDTAGLREAVGTAERVGIALGEDFLESSQAWLLVVDGTEGLRREDRDLLRRFSEKPHAILWNKCDLAGWQPPELSGAETALAVSARDSASLSRLWDFLRSWLASQSAEDEGPLPSAVQASRLSVVENDLRDLAKELERATPPEFLSERVRSAIEKLEAVIGEVSTEDVLDRVFGEFCIGK